MSNNDSFQSDLPEPEDDFDIDEYLVAVSYIENYAPVEAQRLLELRNQDSPYVGLIDTVEKARLHIAQEQLVSGKQGNGRPITSAYEKADVKRERDAARKQKQEQRDASKAAYEARLERYAHRRRTIAAAEQTVRDAVAQRKQALLDFNKQWEAYLDHPRSEVSRLKSIPAVDWPEE